MKTIAKKSYKVEYADTEFNFLSEYVFEAASDFEARYMAEKIMEWYHGDLLELYVADPVTREWLTVQNKMKKAIYNYPIKSVI